MVAGCLPFEHDNTAALYDQILNARYRCPSHLSPACKDLISRILVIDPRRRFGAEEVRRHPWMRGASAAVSLVRSPVPPSALAAAAQARDAVSARALLTMHAPRGSDSVLPVVARAAAELGVPAAQLLEALGSRSHNAATATYFLLLRQALRRGDALALLDGMATPSLPEGAPSLPGQLNAAPLPADELGQGRTASERAGSRPWSARRGVASPRREETASSEGVERKAPSSPSNSGGAGKAPEPSQVQPLPKPGPARDTRPTSAARSRVPGLDLRAVRRGSGAAVASGSARGSSRAAHDPDAWRQREAAFRSYDEQDALGPAGSHASVESSSARRRARTAVPAARARGGGQAEAPPLQLRVEHVSGHGGSAEGAHPPMATAAGSSAATSAASGAVTRSQPRPPSARRPVSARPGSRLSALSSQQPRRASRLYAAVGSSARGSFTSREGRPTSGVRGSRGPPQAFATDSHDSVPVLSPGIASRAGPGAPSPTSRPSSARAQRAQRLERLSLLTGQNGSRRSPRTSSRQGRPGSRSAGPPVGGGAGALAAGPDSQELDAAAAAAAASLGNAAHRLTLGQHGGYDYVRSSGYGGNSGDASGRRRQSRSTRSRGSAATASGGSFESGGSSSRRGGRSARRNVAQAQAAPQRSPRRGTPSDRVLTARSLSPRARPVVPDSPAASAANRVSPSGSRPFPVSPQRDPRGASRTYHHQAAGGLSPRAGAGAGSGGSPQARRRATRSGDSGQQPQQLRFVDSGNGASSAGVSMTPDARAGGGSAGATGAFFGGSEAHAARQASQPQAGGLDGEVVAQPVSSGRVAYVYSRRRPPSAARPGSRGIDTGQHSPKAAAGAPAAPARPSTDPAEPAVASDGRAGLGGTPQEGTCLAPSAPAPGAPVPMRPHAPAPPRGAFVAGAPPGTAPEPKDHSGRGRRFVVPAAPPQQWSAVDEPMPPQARAPQLSAPATQQTHGADVAMDEASPASGAPGPRAARARMHRPPAAWASSGGSAGDAEADIAAPVRPHYHSVDHAAAAGAAPGMVGSGASASGGASTGSHTAVDWARETAARPPLRATALGTTGAGAKVAIGPLHGETAAGSSAGGTGATDATVHARPARAFGTVPPAPVQRIDVA